MRGVNRRQLAVLTVSLAGLAWGGCASSPAWHWPWDKPKPVEQASDIPSPAETTAAIQKMGEEAAKATPEEQQRLSQQLSEMIRKEKDPLIRAEIVRVVAKCSTATATQVALAAIKDPDSDVRLAACDALGKRGGAAAVAALSDALKLDLESEVRLAAAKALGETHDPAAVPALGVALEDQDPAMQYRAVNSLRAISGKDLGNDVQRWRQYVKGELPPEPTFAERLRNLF